MMSRASRTLKWVGAGTVLLAAAPIAYAVSYPAPDRDPESPAHSAARCGGGPEDYAGTYVSTGPTHATYRFDLTAMLVTTQPFSGQAEPGTPLAPGTWQAGDGAIDWSVGGVAYASKPGSTACTDLSSASTVTAFTADSPDGADTLTFHRR
ncbi:MAG TPA: hypothetical protein VH372_14465 [Actinospica sp.]|jgi:hypothetical protein|nr:hypothetical protein [Actinospica sp.]